MSEIVVPVENANPKRCGWLFNISLTAFWLLLMFVDVAFDSAKKTHSSDASNLSKLPWVKGNENIELLTGLGLSVVVIALLTIMSCTTWNRLVVRLFKLPTLTFGETYAVVMWVIIICTTLK